MKSSASTQRTLNTTSGNRTLVWVFVGIAVIANIAGYAFNLYTQFWWFDKVLHGYTMFAITLLVALGAFGIVLKGQREHKFLLALLIIAIGIAIGALWEVAEWAFDQVSSGNVIQGKFDTITDLIVDTVGAIVASLVALGMLDES